MREERIVEILGLVDEKYIEEATPAPNVVYAGESVDGGKGSAAKKDGGGEGSATKKDGVGSAAKKDGSGETSTVKKVSSGRKYYNWAKWAVSAACVVGISWYGFNQFGGPKAEGEYSVPVESQGPHFEEPEAGEEAVEEMTPPAVTPWIEPTAAPEVTPGIEPSAISELINDPFMAELELPLLSAEIHVGGMGFEGLMFYDISESSSANPWTTDAELETLPVYKNSAYVENGPGFVIYLSNEEMVAKAEEVAKALGTEILSVGYEKVPESVAQHLDREGEVYAITAETPEGEITIDGNGAVEIDYDSTIALPEEYDFIEAENNQEEAERIVNYLLEQYNMLHTFEQPVVDTWGDYSFSGDKHRYYESFDKRGALETQILNYNFNTIRFYSDTYGELWIIRYGNLLECAEKIGDYPIISWETAQKLLLNGDYITTVPEEYLEDGIIKEEYIDKVELVYRTGNLEEMFMPYYRFYVELQEDGFSMAEGLKNYGAFYVPAVSGEYLTNFPVWDGRFN